MKSTALHDTHLAAGARMVEFGGWHMPVQYGPILEEVRLVRERSGLFDLCHMGRVEISGADAVRFVDRVATCWCGGMKPGAIRYGLLCREDGNPIDDVLVYRGTEEVFVVVNASNTEADLTWLGDHASGFAVRIEDRTGALAMLALQGPLSARVLQRVVPDLDLASVGYYKFASGSVCGMPGVRISRTGYTGEDGFEVYFPVAESERVWNELLAAGEPEGMRPIGLGARDVLRLEAGMPLYGHEIDAEHNPIEAGLSFGVSFRPEKGDWIGRSALEGVRANPRRALAGIVTDGPRVPRRGYELHHDGRRVGEVCSGAVSPTLAKNIGTAYLPLDLARPGSQVEMDLRGKRQVCEVVALPFYFRTR